MRYSLAKILQDNSTISSDLATQVANMYTAKSYPSGTVLVSPGTTCTKAAFIHSGVLKYYHKGRKDEELIMNFQYGPSFTIYSSVGFFMQSPAQLYCETITDVDLLEVNSSELLILADNNPSIYDFLLRLVTTTHQHRLIKDFSTLEKTSMERYVEFSKEHPVLLNCVPMKTIASYLNIRPGSLSRIRKKLKT